MVNYIVQIVKNIKAGNAQNGYPIFDFQGLSEELNRLDPRDFIYDVQVRFVELRGLARRIASLSQVGGDDRQIIARFCDDILPVLDGYGGEGSRTVSRAFPFILDVGLRAIVERDYRELSLILMPANAWKSAVIMAGSILEAILYDQLTSDPTKKTQALGSSVAPRARRTVKDIDKDEWTLADMVKVAADISVIPKQRGDAIDQTLRFYRNFVHPRREIKEQHPCTDAEAMMAKGALDAVCNHLTP